LATKNVYIAAIGLIIIIIIIMVSTLAQSYHHASSHLAGGAVELATSWKEAKYASLPRAFFFSQSHLKLWVQLPPSASNFMRESLTHLTHEI